MKRVASYLQIQVRRGQLCGSWKYLREHKSQYISLRLWLSSGCSDDDSSSTVSVIRRQAVSLLSFAGHALRIMSITPEESGLSPASRIITLLLELAASKDTQTPGDDVVKLARTATENALRAMSAKDFVEGVLTVLQSSASVSIFIVWPACLVDRHSRSMKEPLSYWETSCLMLPQMSGMV